MGIAEANPSGSTQKTTLRVVFFIYSLVLLDYKGIHEPPIVGFASGSRRPAHQLDPWPIPSVLQKKQQKVFIGQSILHFIHYTHFYPFYF